MTSESLPYKVYILWRTITSGPKSSRPRRLEINCSKFACNTSREAQMVSGEELGCVVFVTSAGYFAHVGSYPSSPTRTAFQSEYILVYICGLGGVLLEDLRVQKQQMLSCPLGIIMPFARNFSITNRNKQTNKQIDRPRTQWLTPFAGM